MDDYLIELFHPYKKEKGKVQSNNLAAWRRGAIGSLTVEEWLALIAKYNYTCLRCKQQEPNILLTFDHILPIVKGGSNTIDNIQPLCGPCNNKKSSDSTDYRK